MTKAGSKNETLIAASILSADFANLGAEVEAVDKAGSDWIHVDVMDGHFVPNLTFGAPVIKSVRGYSEKPFDVHLMIEPVLPMLDNFIDAGADRITFHPHAETDPWRVTQYLAERNISAGLALSPLIPLNVVENSLSDIDLLLIMTVEPGFGGQSFMHEVTEKIREAKAMIKAGKHKVRLQVDGGINAETAPLVRAAGADVLVAGSAVFTGNSADYAKNIKLLKGG